MVLRKPFSYRWRLFFPLILLLWSTIAALVIIQYDREKTYRSDLAKQQLEFVNKRVIFAYEHGVDLKPFMKFVNEYFDQSVYDEVRVSVYNMDSCQLIHSIGEPIKLDKKESELRPNFYYSMQKSNDGKVVVYTAMPYTVTLTEALDPDRTIWIIILFFAIIVTVIAFISTSYLSKNVKLLHKFAKHATTETSLDASYRFPNDELGEVSQQIVTLFNNMTNAIEEKEKEHNIALEAIKEKSRIKRELTNNISHELKTPVGIIKGYIDSIADDPEMSADTREHFISKTQIQITRLCDMLNDISTITRLSEASTEIPKQELNFFNLISTIANDIKDSGVIKEMTFSFGIPRNCTIIGNPSILNSTITNLIKNSAIYSRGTKIRLELCDEDDNFYSFVFYDNGIGVSEEHLPNLFDRFYRIDTGRSRRVGGTGLGLAIVQRAIINHGGDITVSNRPEGGLQFHFTLPKVQL